MQQRQVSMELFDKKTLESIGKKILKKKQTVAVAESVTSGLLQFAFSNIPDASSFYQGGITAFNIGQKFKHLQVEPLHALSVNCVSQKVANEMAAEICSRFSSDWGIGITGYASSVPESGNKVFAFYSIVYKNKLKAKGKMNPAASDPADIQREYVKTVMKNLLRLI